MIFQQFVLYPLAIIVGEFVYLEIVGDFVFSSNHWSQLKMDTSEHGSYGKQNPKVKGLLNAFQQIEPFFVSQVM